MSTVARDTKEAPTLSVLLKPFVHTLALPGKASPYICFNSSGAVLYKMSRRAKQVTRELLTLRMDENSRYWLHLSYTIHHEGELAGAKFKANPL